MLQSMNTRSQGSPWFFVGSFLLICGVVATASSLVNRDAATGQTVLLDQPHPDILWGLLLLVVGAISCFRFYPKNVD